MPARIIVPAGALQAAAETLVRLCLDDGHACVGVARRALALDIAARVIAAELEREAALVEAYRLRGRSAGNDDEDGDGQECGGSHLNGCLAVADAPTQHPNVAIDRVPALFRRGLEATIYSV